jgi:hypothetical protein
MLKKFVAALALALVVTMGSVAPADAKRDSGWGCGGACKGVVVSTR